jgi:signal transduction histidine kinase
LQRWQFLRRILSYVWDTSNLLCQKLFCNITIEVHDTGPDILPHNRDKIFTPYFSTKKHGTRLGLSFVQYIVVAHHSPIVLVTEDAILGATFRIELSLKQPQAICVLQAQ